MGDDIVRPNLIAQINAAFSASQIGETLQRVSPVGPRDDVFTILEKLGFLSFITGTVQQYRRTVGIPRLIQRILTMAFRASLLNRPRPIPLKIDIVGRRREAVAIEVGPDLISVQLTRTR
jgi:hypothetical protein